MDEDIFGTGVGVGGWFLVSLKSHSVASHILPSAFCHVGLDIKGPWPLYQHLSTIPNPSSSNNEADKFYNAQHHTRIYNKM